MNELGILSVIIFGFILFIILIWIIGSIIENVAKKRAAFRRQIEKEKKEKEEKEELMPLAEQKAKELLTKFDSNPILHEIAKRFANSVDRCIRQHKLGFGFELTSQKVELRYSIGYAVDKDCVFFSDYNLKPLNSILERAAFIYLIVCDIGKLCQYPIDFELTLAYNARSLCPVRYDGDYGFNMDVSRLHMHLNTNKEFIDFVFHYYVAEKEVKLAAKKLGEKNIDNAIGLFNLSCSVKEKIGENDW